MNSFSYLIAKTKKILKDLRISFIFIMLGIILINYFTFKNPDVIILSIIIFLILIVEEFNISAKFIFITLIFIFTTCSTMFIFKKDIAAQNLSFWIYVLLIIGLLRLPKDNKIKSNELFIEKSLLFLKKIYTKVFDISHRIISYVFNIHPKTILDITFNIVKLILFITIIFFATFFSYKMIIDVRTRKMIENSKRQRANLNPKILKIEPKIVYPATKVIIWGKGFGWKENNEISLHVNSEIVDTDLLTDSKIILTVPLHWKKPQKLEFWIEKPSSWNGKAIIAKSEKVSINLIQVTSSFTKDDDLYFKELKNLNKETLEINGYNYKDEE